MTASPGGFAPMNSASPVDTYQGVITGQMPSSGQILACTFWSVLLVVVGAWSFLRYERAFALYV